MKHVLQTYIIDSNEALDLKLGIRFIYIVIFF